MSKSVEGHFATPPLGPRLGERLLPVVVITGATASGKSALALEIARRHNAVIINADSIQVYKELPILTALPSSTDLLEVPHLLYGSLPLEKKATAVWWRDQVKPLLDQAYDAEHIPIIVGGTGFYIKTLLDGISDIPPVDPAIFEQEKNILASQGPKTRWEGLREVDPISAARIDPMDSQRILRAWSVWRSSGKALSVWQTRASGGIEKDLRFSWIKVFVNPPRAHLKDKIARRWVQMEQAGVIDEVEHFLQACQDTLTPLHKAVGMEEIRGYLTQKWSYQEAIERINHGTCRLAKRQVTWFKHQFKYSITNSAEDSEENQEILHLILKAIEGVRE